MNRLIEFNTSELTGLVGDLNNASEVLTEGAAKAINTVAKATREQTVLEITSQVNLKKSHVDEKVALTQEATPTKLRAVLEVTDAASFLSTFGGQQQATENDWTLSSWVAKTGGRPSILPNSDKNGKGKLAGWVPRKGDPLRAIAPGAKAAGIKARVSNGLSGSGNMTFKHVFMQPVRSGKNMMGRWGSFSRPKGGGAPKAIYGPSAYQVAKGVWRDFETEISENLEAEVTKDVSDLVERALIK